MKKVMFLVIILCMAMAGVVSAGEAKYEVWAGGGSMAEAITRIMDPAAPAPDEVHMLPDTDGPGEDNPNLNILTNFAISIYVGKSTNVCILAYTH